MVLSAVLALLISLVQGTPGAQADGPCVDTLKSLLSAKPQTAVLLQMLGQMEESLVQGIRPQLEAFPYKVTAEQVPVFQKAAQKAAALPGENSLTYYFDVLSDPELARFPDQTLDKAFFRVKNAEDPYTTGHYLVPDSNHSRQALERDLVSFVAITQIQDPAAAALKASQWIRSDEHALYFYQNIQSFGPRADRVLDRVSSENLFFKGVARVEGTPTGVVTYAFEKETTNPLVTLYYRPPKVSEAEWSHVPEKQRIDTLKRITDGEEKVFLPASVITATELKPRYLGGYSQELLVSADSSSGRFAWEFAHRNYEIQRRRVVEAMRDLSGELKETHSFHAHVVTELPKDYARFSEFKIWHKQLNDHLYLSGMEEGLHGNDLTRLAEVPTRKKGFMGALRSLMEPVDPKKYLPVSFPEVRAYNYKFFSAGVRADIYGAASTPAYRKIGIELRDVSRNMKTWETHLNRVGEAVERRHWELPAPIDPRDPELVHLRSATPSDVEYFRQQLGIRPDIAKQLIEADPTLLIPLEHYESAKYFNYQTRQFERPSAEAVQRIQQARQVYLQDLKNLQAEIDRLTAAKDLPGKEDIQGAIRMSMTEWARRARVAQYFGGI